LNNKIIVIAEAGVNHNGNVDLAMQLVDAAVKSGADIVKFQTFKAKNIVTKSVSKADYQKNTTNKEESQYDMLKALELTYGDTVKIMKHCEQNKIKFLSSAFDHDSLDFLTNKLNLKTLKIASGEITNGPLLLSHAQTGCNIILSTGISSLKEIQIALSIIAFGLIHGANLKENPSLKSFQKAFKSEVGQSLLKRKVTILHCTTEYPAPLEDSNLKAITTLQNKFGLRIGYSDHTKGIIVSVFAAAMGAKLIEKHFTLDKEMHGPDHKASLSPLELKRMVEMIRDLEKSMGDGIKTPKKSELKNKYIVRKSLVALTPIKKGDVFTEQNLSIKRPGNGKSPMLYWDILGTKSFRDYGEDEVLF